MLIFIWMRLRIAMKMRNEDSNQYKTLQRATSQYKQAGEWDKAADTLATMADIYRKQVFPFDSILMRNMIIIKRRGC